MQNDDVVGAKKGQWRVAVDSGLFTLWAIKAEIFKGIKIGSSLNISHLFYADDAVFIGVEWSSGSIANLSGYYSHFHWFSLLYGTLDTIFIEMSLLGVSGFESEDVKAAAFI
ncbi:hypothetical protein Tco_1086182 [Tanacetum coccineum]